MQLKKLAEKATKLPELEFDWTGEEQWARETFDCEITDLPRSIAYIKILKERISAQSFMIHDLVEAYKGVKDVILKADVEPEAKTIKMSSEETIMKWKSISKNGYPKVGTKVLTYAGVYKDLDSDVVRVYRLLDAQAIKISNYITHWMYLKKPEADTKSMENRCPKCNGSEIVLHCESCECRWIE